MLTKIQKLTVFLVALGLVTTSLALFTSPKVYADYTVGAGQKCQDNSNPTTVNNAGAVTYSCADSTKTGGTNPNAGGSGQGANNNNSTSCAVEKIGWILCPIIEGSAKVADKLFQFLADHFLETEPELLSDSSGTKKAWDQAIMLANVMFVIAFIVVIYSQITGAGLSNYGIKRMLPRLILAAIMVNLSFYICQAMADLSNLLGYEIMTIMTDLAKNAGPSVMMQADNQGLNTQTSDGILAKVAVGALAVGGLVWMFLAPMGGIILMVLITCLITIILLLLRKALIVLLVVVSPFAFVAYLLPNTEKLFNKWLDMYWKLLLVFPIVATLLGSGQLASAIILTAGIQAGNTGSTSQNCDTNSPDSQKVKGGGLSVPCEGSVDLDGGTSGQGRKAGWMLALVATGVAVGPVLAAASVIAALIKTSSAIAGKMGAAIQKGTAGGVNGGVNLGKKAKERYDASTMGKARAREKKIREGEIRAGSYSGSMRNPLNWSRRSRSAANRTLNSMGEGVDPNSKRLDRVLRRQYGAQRDRETRGALAERTREKAQEFEGNMNYAEEFDKAQREFMSASNRNDRDEALLKMNAAAIAASRLDDRSQLDRMRPTIRQYSGMNRNPVNQGGLATNQATRAANTGDTYDAAAAMNAQFDAERAAAMNADHDTALAMNREFDARQRQERIQNETQLNNLANSPGMIHDPNLAHEIALRENANRPPSSPGGGSGGAGGGPGTGGAGGTP